MKMTMVAARLVCRFPAFLILAAPHPIGTHALSSIADSFFPEIISHDSNNADNVRYRCRVAYDGAGFDGFQIQPHARTIQGDLEEVLSRRFNRPVRVQGAGRTDAGVHARGQAIHFDILQKEEETSLTLEDISHLERSLNKMLRPDIRVWNLNQAPPPSVELVNGQEKVFDWNVMRNCHSKLYSYRFSTSPAMDPLERHSRWQLDLASNAHFDIELLRRLLKEYEGTNDFCCFAHALEQTQRKTGRIMSTIRTVYNVSLIEEKGVDSNYRIDFVLQGALYKMVRNMVGTAIDVCRGRMTEETFRSLINPKTGQNVLGRDDNLSKPAPPQGLTLEQVYYPDDF
jgi:tRNA pseudouridine38-40 synthase